MSKRNPRQAIRNSAPEYAPGAAGVQGERAILSRKPRPGDVGDLLNEAFYGSGSPASH